MKTTKKEQQHESQRLDDRTRGRGVRWHKLPKSVDLSKARHPSNAGYVRGQQASVEQEPYRVVGLPKSKSGVGRRPIRNFVRYVIQRLIP